MESIKRPATGERIVPSQEFDGKVYHLYKGERYYSRGRVRMHRAVWEYYNGPVPPGYDIHHKDGNPANNDISNLACIPSKKHHLEHHEDAVLRGKTEEQLAIIRKAGECAKEWHHSNAGREWHSQHAKQQFAGLEIREGICDCCGKSFKYKNISAPRFCSNACKSRWRRNAGVDNEMRTCVYCGKPFEANHYSDTITCSKSCAAKYRWGKRRDGVGV
jgi:hypothetical protein